MELDGTVSVVSVVCRVGWYSEYSVCSSVVQAVYPAVM